MNEPLIGVVRSWVGMSGRHPDPAVRERQAKLLLPHDGLPWALRYLSQKGVHGYTSTCALVEAAYMRERGVTHERLDRPYEKQSGAAMTNVERVARAIGAWTDEHRHLTEYPYPEDVIRLDNADRTNAHVLIVVDSIPATGEVVSIDGGQVDGTWTMERRRKMVIHRDTPFLVDSEKPHLADGSPNGREITGRVMLGEGGSP